MTFRWTLNFPKALGEDPLMLVFWAILAPALFLYGSALIAVSVIPAFEPGTAAELQAYQTAWFFNCVGMAAWFAAMTYWSELSGAGPFAGPIHLPPNWLTVTLIAGPVLLLVPNLIMNALMSSEQWAYRDDVNAEALSPSNWSLAFVLLAALLAPIAEELAFRGIVLGGLITRGVTPAFAAIVSSAAFAFIHMHYTATGMFVVFLAGLGFAALRLLSGSLLIPIIAHASGNGFILWVNWLAPSV